MPVMLALPVLAKTMVMDTGDAGNTGVAGNVWSQTW